MREIVLIAHNLRSSHNVGSLLRTAEGLGISKVYLTGYAPHPKQANDDRLPHIAVKVDKQIAKTALGSENQVKWDFAANIEPVITELKDSGFRLVALEQTDDSTPLPKFEVSEKIALVVGREVEGIEPEVIALCDDTVEIPMFGKKESFNVVQSAAMALYQFRFAP